MKVCLWLLNLSLCVQALRHGFLAVGNGTLAEQAPSPSSPGPRRGRVLVFVPVGHKDRTIQLVTSNVDHLRTFEAAV
eukprot:CAMPEP_0171202850 /NCGR_PEP_ID=MMETSP0790-20130122/25216_1 /TAXON_ID=2925 /ORGANISM="Alexandrium catenella, Strain OF101" /LENGTH=76 /DNA_ID=CAMNT_0011668289 /DNA_START=91 /DNA_END=318 /DNA_ORIENTATION=-